MTELVNETKQIELAPKSRRMWDYYTPEEDRNLRLYEMVPWIEVIEIKNGWG